MQKKNATQRRRISYYSGWRTRLERKSHFYFWCLWRWVHGVHISLTTTIYWLQTFSRHADKLFIVTLQRQCQEGDLVWEGKAAYLLTLWAGGMSAEQPHLISCLGLTAHSQGRGLHVTWGPHGIPGKWEAAMGCRQQGTPEQSSIAPFLDMTWELAMGSWPSLSLRINEKVLSNLL